MRHNELQKRYVEYLNALNLHLVRSLARAVGVSNPTKGQKDELIDRIVAILLGVAEPVPPTKRGAPIREEPIDPKYLKELTEIREKYRKERQALLDHFKALEQPQNEMSVNTSEDFFARWEEENRMEAMNRRDGILELLPSGEGILRGLDYASLREELLIPKEIQEAYGMKEGDLISAEFKPDENGALRMKKLYTINYQMQHTKERPCFEEIMPMPNQKKLFLNTEKNDPDSEIFRYVTETKPIYRGQRVLVASGDDALTVRYIGELLSPLMYGAERVRAMFLLLNSSPDDAAFIEKRFRGAEIAYSEIATRAEKLQTAKLFFNRVTRLAEEGHDIVVYIDSVNELIRLCNMGQTQSMLPCGLSANAFIPVKRWMSLARDTGTNGSLTFFGAVQKEGEVNEFIFEEMEAMVNHVLDFKSDLPQGEEEPTGETE